MSEKRFECVFIEDDEFGGTYRRLKDNETGIMHMTCDVVDLLNFQNTQIKILKEENEQLQKYNKQLKERLEKINGGYGHLTHRNGLTANEWLIESQERELKKKNEEISDWIERHSKDIAKIGEQKSTISQLEEENEQLKQQLLYDGDDVCGICKHEYLTPSRDYFIGKCEKGHEECSTEDIKYCEDFKLKEADDE